MEKEHKLHLLSFLNATRLEFMLLHNVEGELQVKFLPQEAIIGHVKKRNIIRNVRNFDNGCKIILTF